MVHIHMAISIPRWCFKYPLPSPRAQEHPKNSAADPDRWSKTSQKPPVPKRINPDVLPRPRQARPMPRGMPRGMLGDAMAGPGKGHLSELRLSKNTKGLDRWISAGSKLDVSILELGMRSLDHSESKRRDRAWSGLVAFSNSCCDPKMSQA